MFAYMLTEDENIEISVNKKFAKELLTFMAEDIYYRMFSGHRSLNKSPRIEKEILKGIYEKYLWFIKNVAKSREQKFTFRINKAYAEVYFLHFLKDIVDISCAYTPQPSDSFIEVTKSLISVVEKSL